MLVVYFSSATRNTERFVEKLDLPSKRIPLRKTEPPQVVKEHGVAVDVLEEELVGGLPVLAELDLPIGVIQVEQGVQRVVVELFFFAGRFSHGLTVGCGHKYTFTDVVGLG